MIGRSKYILLATGMIALAACWYFFSGPTPLLLAGQQQVVGFSDDGLVLATVDKNGTGQLWDPQTGESRKDLAGELTGLKTPFSPSAQYCVELQDAKPPNERVLVMTESGNPILRFPHLCSAGFYQRLAFGFTPDSRYFYSPVADAKGNLSGTGLWSLPDGQQSEVGKKVVLAVSPRGEHLAFTSLINNSDQRVIELFSIANEAVESSFDHLATHVVVQQYAAFSSTGERLAIGWEGGSSPKSTIKVLDIESGMILADHELQTNYLSRPRFIDNDQLIAIRMGNQASPIAVCLAETNQPGVQWKVNALSQNDRWGVTASKEHDAVSRWFEINVFEITAARATNPLPTKTMKFPIEQWGYPPNCSISNDGRRVAVSFRYDYADNIGVSESSQIAVVDVDSKQVIWKWRGKDHPANVVLSPDGSLIALKQSLLKPIVEVHAIP